MNKVSQNQMNLAIMIGANIHFVSEEVAAYYTRTENRGQIPVLLGGFVLPTSVQESVVQVDQPKATPSILELVSTVVVSATTCKFVAKEKFVRDTGHKAKVKIDNLGDNFKAWFLNGNSKTEEPIMEQTLRYHKLRKASVDGPIIEELGGAEKSETTLSEMFSLMEKQKNGEDGVLLNNGYANILYIKDIAGVLRTVSVHWYVVGWHVSAGSVEHPVRWNDGHRVFSRNSVLEFSEPSAPAQA